jgi:hypothetical protein
MERLIEAALRERGLDFIGEDHPLNVAKLDFYLPRLDLYIEVKRMHLPRIAEQMARGANVIAIQGEGAVRAFVEMLLQRQVKFDGDHI